MLIKPGITADTNPELHLMLIRLFAVAEMVIAPSSPKQTQEQESDPLVAHEEPVTTQKLHRSQADV